MKGKYAKRAERTRDSAALEQRAVSAEQERDRFARERAVAAAKHERQIAALKAELAEVRSQRDQGASQRVAELEAANNRLRAKCESLRGQVNYERDVVRKALDATESHLRDRLGWSALEAREFTTATGYPELDDIVMQPHHGGSRDPKALRAVQRARGLRGSPGAAVDRPARVASHKQILAERAIVAAEEEDRLAVPTYTCENGAVLVVYRYDDGLSLTIEGDDPSIFIPAAERPAFSEAIVDSP